MAKPMASHDLFAEPPGPGAAASMSSAVGCSGCSCTVFAGLGGVGTFTGNSMGIYGKSMLNYGKSMVKQWKTMEIYGKSMENCGKISSFDVCCLIWNVFG